MKGVEMFILNLIQNSFFTYNLHCTTLIHTKINLPTIVVVRIMCHETLNI